MKRIVLIVLIVLILSKVSLALDSDTLFHLFAKCETLTDFQKCIKNKFQDFRLGDQHEILNRPIGFGYKQLILTIRCNHSDNSCQFFRIYLIIKKRRIVLGALQLDNHDLVDTFTSRKFKISESDIDNYLHKHLLEFKKECNRKEFISQLTTLKTYGFDCGFVGTNNSPEALKMKDYVENNNYAELSNWLREINPEIQTYGMVGLFNLMKKGVKVMDDDKLIIHHLRRRNSEIYCCIGCRFGVQINLKKIVGIDEK